MEINGKRVIDAKKSLRITISARDAALGNRKDPGACAAARAIVRSIVDAKKARVHLGRTYIEFSDHLVRYKTPASLKNEIVSFDRGGKAQYSEGEYNLQAISSVDRLGMRKKVAGKTSGKHRKHIARVHHQIEGVRARGANK
jgi:hypothetical protein